MSNIEKQIKKAVGDYKPKDNTYRELESFKQATKKFNKLVESGIVAKRGNQLRNIESAHLNYYSVNNEA